jgi:stage V sporulation protein R
MSPGTQTVTPEKMPPLYVGADWNFSSLKTVYDAIEKVAVGEMGLDVYPNQIEVITSEQMLDAYSSIGMPLLYRHWSFGKHFARDEMLYRKGARALAYEIVINSNPCISYVMEENSMTMQALVIAHAAFGHNHFFKNNYLFKQWTQADAILDYLSFAKEYVTKAEERHGVEAVEAVLDSAHALMRQGVSRYPGKKDSRSTAAHKEQARESRRRDHEEATFSDLWRTLPKAAANGAGAKDKPTERLVTHQETVVLGLPEENLLYFLEKNAPKLEGWKRELLRIVRMLATYLYPQRQTKMMNEGCATFVHYEIMNRLYNRGALSEGHMLEFLHSHSGVVFQPSFDKPYYSGINPYALGFAMMSDIKRMCEEPTSEDREWFPQIAGNGDALGTLKTAWAEYRDESFVLQYLSPKVIRDFHLFAVTNDSSASAVRVDAIHNERGYRNVRQRLARHYDTTSDDPSLEVTDADLSGARRLVVTHRVRKGILLDKEEADRTLLHLAQLWGYRVRLIEVDDQTGKTLKEHEALPMP